MVQGNNLSGWIIFVLDLFVPAQAGSNEIITSLGLGMFLFGLGR